MAPAKILRLSLLIFLILHLCSCTPRAYVSRARTLALKGMKLDTALQLIDRAKQDKKIAGEAKTYFVEGFIYQKMYEAGGKEYTQGNSPLMKAFDSYSKAYEIDNIYGLRAGFAEIHQFLIDEGIKAYEQKDYSTALPYLEHTLKISELPIFPGQTDTSIIYMAGIAAMETGKWKEAADHFQQSIDYRYMGARAYQLMGVSLKKSGDDHQARSILEKGLEIYPEDNNLMGSLINLHIESNRYTEALECLGRATKVWPQKANYHLTSGYLHEKMGQTEPAIQDYLKAKDIDPSLFEAHHSLGRLFLKLAAEKEEGSAHCITGKSNPAAEKYYTRAARSLQKAHELKPDNLAVFSTLKYTGQVLSSQNPEYKVLYKNLRSEADQLVSQIRSGDMGTNPLTNHRNFVINRGIKALDNQKNQAALDYFEYAITQPEMNALQGQVDTALLYNAGLAAWKLEKWNRAIAYLKQITGYSFQDGVTFLLLSEAYTRKGDERRSLEVLQQGVISHPTNNQLVGRLINHYLFESAHPREALPYLKTAIRANPNNAQHHAARGQVYQKTNKKEKAKACYLQALEIDPDLMRANYNLGSSIYYNEGMKYASRANHTDDDQLRRQYRQKANSSFQKAARCLEKVLKFRPDDTSLLRTLKSLYYRLKSEDPAYKEKYQHVVGKLR